MKNGNHQADYVLAACGIVPVVWLALLAAPDLSGGLFAVIERFPKAIGHPFHNLRRQHKNGHCFSACLWPGDWDLLLHAQELPQGRRTWLRRLGECQGSQ